MGMVHQRFAPRPVTLVTIVALAFAAVMFVALSPPAAAQTRPAATTVRPAATAVRPAATAARPAATAVRPAATAARPAAPAMPRAGGGGMATSFTDEGGTNGLWVGLIGLAAVGGAGVFTARRLRRSDARVLLH